MPTKARKIKRSGTKRFYNAPLIRMEPPEPAPAPTSPPPSQLDAALSRAMELCQTPCAEPTAWSRLLREFPKLTDTEISELRGATRVLFLIRTHSRSILREFGHGGDVHR